MTKFYLSLVNLTLIKYSTRPQNLQGVNLQTKLCDLYKAAVQEMFIELY